MIRIGERRLSQLKREDEKGKGAWTRKEKEVAKEHDSINQSITFKTRSYSS